MTLPPRPLPETPSDRGSIPRVPRQEAPGPWSGPATQQGSGGWGEVIGQVLTGGGGRRQSPLEAMTKSVVRSVGSSVGRQLGNAVVRGVLGSILKR